MNIQTHVGRKKAWHPLGKPNSDIRSLALLALAGTTIILSGCGTTPTIASIAITPAVGTEVLSTSGQAVQFHAIGSFTRASTQPIFTKDITDTVTWTSLDTAVATVNSTGMVTATGDGMAYIQASSLGMSNIVTTTSNVQVGPTSLPVITVVKTGKNGAAGNVTATYMAQTANSIDMITAINCSPTSTSAQCSAYLPVGAEVTFTTTDTASGTPVFGGWSANCTPVYLTQPTTTTPGVVALPNSCTLVTGSSNLSVNAIFN